MKKHAQVQEEDLLYHIPQFESVTKRFLQSRASHQICCPRCGALLNFQRDIEWQGPDHFTCGKRERLISKNLILKAMSDLGLT